MRRAASIFGTGTNLVVALDDGLILKVFPPLLRHQFVSERVSLSQLRGRLRVAIPESWSRASATMALSRHHAAAGVVGAEAWPRCRKTEKERVLGQSARRSRKCSGCRWRIARIEPDWDCFMRGQIEGCRARHERLGLPQKFLDGLDDLLRDAAALIPLDTAGDPDRRIHPGEFSAEPRWPAGVSRA